jgi:BirA family biotin operon repressor/biotin-[acetyl-CoA-carboxylase] ligase
MDPKPATPVPAADASPPKHARAGSGPDLPLTADALLPDLETCWLARRIVWHDRLDSTNRLAGQLASEGAAAGTAVIAEAQSAGRGRLGRSFHSPHGVNLYTSLVLRPELPLSAAPLLVLVAAVAVAETVAAELEDAQRVAIKWPNDVQIDGHKVSGILMEASAVGERVASVVLGIGVNLNADPADFPDDFRARATSLGAASGRPVDRHAFTRRLFGTLESVLELHASQGFESVAARFGAFFRMTGARLAVADPDGRQRHGRALGIDPDGALRIACDDGSQQRVLAGDVTILKEDPAR